MNKNNKGLTVAIVNTGGHDLPKYKTEQSAGLDLSANLKAPVILKPLERVLIPTGLNISIPDGYEGQVRPRSGLALKHGITVLNATGTIDADYRGDIGVILINLSNESYTVNDGDRVAQLLFAPVTRLCYWIECEELAKTGRGDGGFGSTGA